MPTRPQSGPGRLLRSCSGSDMAWMNVCLDCWRLTSGTRCDEHQQATRRVHRRFQTGATAYNSARWIRLRNRFRTEHPYCVNAAKGDPRCTLLTDIVDHIEPHRGDEALMFDESNLAGMCWSCHSRKTASEVGLTRPRGGIV